MARAVRVDPLASLKPSQVVACVNGRDVTIPAYTAMPWLSVLLAEDPDLTEIFPGFLSEEEYEYVEECLWSGELTADEYNKILQEVVTVCSGRPWWFTMRLAAVARLGWGNLGGEMVLAGVDAYKVTLSAWLDAFWVLLKKSLEPQTKEDVTRNREILESLLEDPEVGQPDYALDEEAESKAFMSLMGAS